MSFKLIDPDELIQERRIAYPGRGMAMDYEKSKTTAIEEFCRNCFQASNCASCTSRNCALFPYRPGANDPDAVQRRPGYDVPTLEQYQELLRAKDPDGAKAAIARERMAQYRAGKVTPSEEDVYEF